MARYQHTFFFPLSLLIVFQCKNKARDEVCGMKRDTIKDTFIPALHHCPFYSSCPSKDGIKEKGMKTRYKSEDSGESKWLHIKSGLHQRNAILCRTC